MEVATDNVGKVGILAGTHVCDVKSFNRLVNFGLRGTSLNLK